MTDKIPDTEAKASFARRIGCSRQNIQKMAARGLPLDPNGDVRVAAALAWIRSNVSQPGSALVDGDAPGLVEAKIKLILLQCARAELELSARRGQLIDRYQAAVSARSVMRTFRDAMLNFANRYGSDIAAEVNADPVLLAGVLEVQMRLALTELAKTRAPPFVAAEEAFLAELHGRQTT